MTTEGWARIGERLREARVVSGKTQQELAEAIGIERTALVRAESGDRKVDALEIYRVASVLDLPLSYFLAESPIETVVSRRTALSDDVADTERSEWYLDVDLGAHASDAAWLDRQGLFPAIQIPRFDLVGEDSARAAARDVRTRVGLAPDLPIEAMAEFCERFGLYLLSVPRQGDGASLVRDGYAVAVVAGRADPGRRRATAAHELGHVVFGDAYSSDIGVADRSDAERWIDAFASELLLPLEIVRDQVSGAKTREDTWERLVKLAGRFRVSWRLAVRAAERSADVDAQHLLARSPLKADFQVLLGYEPSPDLEVGQTGPVWRKAVIEAYRRSLLTAERASEMLHGDLSVSDIRAVADRESI